MTIDEHIKLLEEITVELAATQLDDALLSSLDLSALLKLRLARGENADGGRFTDYSDLYAKERQSKGLQTGRKDFNVTGQLYASIQPEVASSTFGNVQVNITAKGEDNQLKVRGARHYKGDEVLEVSESEINEVARLHSQRRIERAANLLG